MGTPPPPRSPEGLQPLLPAGVNRLWLLLFAMLRRDEAKDMLRWLPRFSSAEELAPDAFSGFSAALLVVWKLEAEASPAGGMSSCFFLKSAFWN